MENYVVNGQIRMKYYTKILISSMLFLFLGCKKNEVNCTDEFYKLYEKRWSLWFGFEKIGVVSNDNFSASEYNKLRKQTNDSLQITIDCALENDKKNEILYLYKMKQLFLADKLNEVNPFLKTVDRKIVKDDIYFQLSLYSMLCKELLTNQKPIDEYKILLKSYSPKLNPVYKDRAIKEFLDYLIDDNIEEFKKNMLKKYPTSNSMSLQDENSRESIIKDIMMRGDNLVFD
ncbi:hypothetical protein [Chryseobacterium taeanense]|uniref:hypothetical protein n=1 Tax=Chryseobacterium taeanense TaxID=311334 RepID=UPI0035B26BC6